MEKYVELFKPSFLKNEERPALPADATPNNGIYTSST